ncbi:MAG: tetratricopeptide repeat protein [Candidatus Hermodarchaeota archaeon]
MKLYGGRSLLCTGAVFIIAGAIYGINGSLEVFLLLFFFGVICVLIEVVDILGKRKKQIQKESHFDQAVQEKQRKYQASLNANTKDSEEITEFKDLLSEGLYFVQRGKLEEALSVFNKGLDNTPENPDLLSEKGSVLSKLGRYNEALEVLNEALKLNPNLKNAANSKDFVLRMLNQ